MRVHLLLWVVLVVTGVASPAGADALAGFAPAGFRDEQQRVWSTGDGVRVLVNAAGHFDAARPTRLVIYALPNGNTIEQTMGCGAGAGVDWRFDIQHVAAQVRKLREVSPAENVVVACVEADGRSWPAWRAARPDNAARIRALVGEIVKLLPGRPPRVTLACHSGGGSFLFGYLNGGDDIPAEIDRLAWLDANYAYDDAEHRHGDKLLAWLRGDASRHLVVIAYDDRDVTLDGKPIVGPTGGTYRASRRMIDRLRRDVTFDESVRGPFERFSGMDGQILVLLHTNLDRKILHTILVERNGLLEALTVGTGAAGRWGGEFWGERAYAALIQPAATTRPAATQPASTRPPVTTPRTATAAAPRAESPEGALADPAARRGDDPFPPRPAGAPGGRAFAASVARLSPAEREAAIVREVLRGNVPSAARVFHPVRVRVAGRECVYEAAGDYLAVGGDEDFVRMPMTPASAAAIAAAVDCTLPTRKIVDDVFAAAAVKLEPKPLTVAREAVATFVEHDGIIRSQLAEKPRDVLVVGHKKDVVLSNRLAEKPGRVAIYGWHKPDGKPIQPLYVGHAAAYVDYSHGVRLVRRRCRLDGGEATIPDLLRHAELSNLISDEGPVTAGYEEGS